MSEKELPNDSVKEKPDVVNAESEKIWAEIQDLPINVFALANQKIKNHVHKMELPGNILYIKLVSSAVLPALEEALGTNFVVEQVDNYIMIKRAGQKVSFPDKKFQPEPYVRVKK